MKKNKEKEPEKTLEESLKDKVYVNYNILLKLEEIKRVLLGIFELNKNLLDILLKTNPEENTKEETETKEIKKEKREGTFK